MSGTEQQLTPAVAVRFDTMVEYQPGAVVSRTLIRKDKGTVTLFAFAAGQGLSEHTAPFDALVQVLDGTAEVIIDGRPVAVACGESVLMPANLPHALKATVPFKMLLVMIRG